MRNETRLKTTFFVLTIALLTFVLCSARADAVVEFCPATVIGFHPILEPGSGNASKTYGYKVGAFGERTTSGTVAIETDKGWFTTPFGKIKLYASTRSIGTGRNEVDLTEFTAPTLFVTFPQSVIVQRMFVASATATGDGQFGWQARGNVPCDPPISLEPPEYAGVWSAADEDEHPPTTFHSPFTQPSVASAATPVEAPVGSSCAQPFVAPKMLTVAKADWPDSLGATYKNPESAGVVAVALDGRGHVEDVWPWIPSPYDELNAAQLDAAVRSTYAPGIALCRPVRSLLFFRYDWSHV